MRGNSFFVVFYKASHIHKERAFTKNTIAFLAYIG